MGQDIELPDLDESTLGPAMLALTPLQRRYVRAIQLIGNGNHTRAAMIAGYGGGEGAIRVSAYACAHNPKIGAALVEEGIVTFQHAANQALASVIDVNNNPMQPKAGLKLKAGLAILDRVGIGIQTTHNVNVTKDAGPNTVMLTKLRLMLVANPKFAEIVPAPIMKMLEATVKKETVDVVDAEFVEVDPDAALLGEA